MTLDLEGLNQEFQGTATLPAPPNPEGSLDIKGLSQEFKTTGVTGTWDAPNEYERKVQHAIQQIEGMDEWDKTLLVTGGPMWNILNVSTWLSTKGYDLPKGIETISKDSPEHKLTTAALFEAIDRYKANLKYSDYKKWASMVGTVGKIATEFKGAPGKTAAKKFAAHELMQLPTARQAQMPMGQYLKEKSLNTVESMVLGKTVGLISKYVPKARYNVPITAGGFMGYTAAKGGSPQEILDSGLLVLGFHAMNLMERSIQSKDPGIKRSLELKAVRKAREQNALLKDVPRKDILKTLKGVAQQKLTLDAAQEPLEAAVAVKGARAAVPAARAEIPKARAEVAVKPRPVTLKSSAQQAAKIAKAPPKAIMGILEPSKIVEKKHGKETYATVIRGIHKPEAKMLDYNSAKLKTYDKTFEQFGRELNKYPKADLENLMLSRGKGLKGAERKLQAKAYTKLPKELKDTKIRRAINEIADFNYKYLQKVTGIDKGYLFDNIHQAQDYFYGIYKPTKNLDKFIVNYQKTTDRFTRQKLLRTYASAKEFGLELRDPNPVNNLRTQHKHIAKLDAMTWLKNELLRTGEGRFIAKEKDQPSWDIIGERLKPEPTFEGLRVEPDLAKLINNLIATNKIQRAPVANALRQTNNFLRTFKFAGSAFHLLQVAKQSVADSGYLGFYKPTARRGFTKGFTKNDPVYKTPQYKDYIEHGGGHRYSVESEAQRVFTQSINKLNKGAKAATKVAVSPLKIPQGFVEWMFKSYIPKVKYSKYLDFMAEKEAKLGRSLKSSEKIDIIKEQQNFYGMMNERLFGRSGTLTTALRFYFMAPGYAEGNYRTMIKAATQWGGEGKFAAGRSRANIINSWILTATAATVGTAVYTGKWPEKPETIEDVRDLLKIDTGKKDERGRKAMIDLATYDKDYWNVFFNTLTGRPDKAIKESIKRIGGMRAPTSEMITDLALIAAGKAIYDWKEDKVFELHDPFLEKTMKTVAHEVKHTAPISVSVYQQSRNKKIDKTIAAVEALLGVRPALTEADKREAEAVRKLYSLQDSPKRRTAYLSEVKNPRAAVDKYNDLVMDIFNSPTTPPELQIKWGPKLLINTEEMLENQAFYLSQKKRTQDEIKRGKKLLANFGIDTPEEAEKYLNRYWLRERPKPAPSVERIPIVGRNIKRTRLKTRWE